MFSLKNHSTFRTDCNAKEIITINKKDDIKNLIANTTIQNNPTRLIIG
jgi:UDP-N-acetylenolpyruvoylglucosamine reductase